MMTEQGGSLQVWRDSPDEIRQAEVIFQAARAGAVRRRSSAGRPPRVPAPMHPRIERASHQHALAVARHDPTSIRQCRNAAPRWAIQTRGFSATNVSPFTV